MEKTCLDTSVLIELARRKLLKYVNPLKDELYLTELTLYEYLRGLEILGRDIEKAKDLLESFFYIIGFDNEAIKIASDIYSKLFKEGIAVPDPDILIASICIVNDIPLATYDKHFQKLEKLGLKLYNPNRIIRELNKRA